MLNFKKKIRMLLKTRCISLTVLSKLSKVSMARISIGLSQHNNRLPRFDDFYLILKVISNDVNEHADLIRKYFKLTKRSVDIKLGLEYAVIQKDYELLTSLLNASRGTKNVELQKMVQIYEVYLDNYIHSRISEDYAPFNDEAFVTFKFSKSNSMQHYNASLALLKLHAHFQTGERKRIKLCIQKFETYLRGIESTIFKEMLLIRFNTLKAAILLTQKNYQCVSVAKETMKIGLIHDFDFYKENLLMYIYQFYALNSKENFFRVVKNRSTAVKCLNANSESEFLRNQLIGSGYKVS